MKVIDFVVNNREKFAMYFLVDDLGYLRKGGRLSTTSFVIGTMLNIKPILKMSSDGAIIKHTVAKGRKKGIKQLFDIVIENGENVADYPICIAYALAENEALELKAMFENHFGKPLNIWLQPIGPTIGTHCGPGALGIAFHSKHR